MKEPIQIKIHSRLEEIKQENPSLFSEIKEFFSPAGLRRQLADYTAAADLAEARAARLKEEIRLIKLKGETVLLERQRHKLKQNRNPEKRMPEVRLLDDRDVEVAYNRMRR